MTAPGATRSASPSASRSARRASSAFTLCAAWMAALACSSGPPAVGARFSAPAAMVAFSGITGKRAEVSPYFAVASARGDELRFIDQHDLIVVVGPGLAFPLSVTTSARPVLLAAASLGDGGADVLAAVSSGFQSLQVVDTWTAQSRVAFEVPLDGLLAPDAEVVAMMGMPARAAAGASPAVPARVVLAVNDADLAAGAFGPATGKLLVVEFDRAPDGSGAVAARALGPDSVKALGFRVEDVASEPPGLPAADGTRLPGTHLYLATRDPVLASDGTVALGVGALDTAASTAAAFTVAALDARAPTLAVGAGWVDERVVDSASHCSTERMQGAPRLQVLAGLDPAGCGPTAAIACGLATLDPATGALALDPAAQVVLPPDAVPGGATAVPAQPFRQPMPVPGVPSHVLVLNAPAGGDPPERLFTETDSSVPSEDCPTVGNGVFPLFRIFPSGGARYTSALAVVTSTNGASYWYDLARFTTSHELRTITNGTTRVQLTAGATSGTGRLGVWSDHTAAPALVSEDTDSVTFLASFDVWPGFTDTDVWSVVYQGSLPQLASRPGLLVSGGGAVHLAAQGDAGNGLPLGDANRWAVTVRVAEPGLGVHAGDIVELIDGSGATVCTTGVSAVLTAAEALAATGVAMPGGAVRLTADAADAPAGCAVALATQPVVAGHRFTVRAPGLVFSSSKLGYLGRPALSSSADPADGRFAVAWSDEAVLAQDTSRAGQEALALARKARRLFYPVEGPCPPITLGFDQTNSRVGCYFGYPRLSDPLQPGPIIRFRLGLMPGSAPLVRGDSLVFTTQRGQLGSSRSPAVGGTLPAGIVPFDWALTDPVDHGGEPIRYLVPYLDDKVVGYSPTGNVQDYYIQ